MNKIATILLSLIILLGIGLLSFFAFNKHQETEIEKEKIKLELAKLESKEKNKKADAKQDKKTQANESKAGEKTPDDKVAGNNLNKTAAECIWEEAFQNTECNLDNYNTDELMKGYSTLIQEGALNGWCKPGGDPGNIKQQIKESIYNQQNNISCEQMFNELENGRKIIFSEEDALQKAAEAVDIDGGDSSRLTMKVIEKVVDNDDEIVYKVAANNKSGSGSNTIIVHSDGNVEIWNGIMTDKISDIYVPARATR